VAVMLLALIIVVSTQAMLQSNRQAAAMRTLTAARGIIQRNIDTALTVAWDSTVEPAILTLTAPGGGVYDDDEPPADTDGLVQISVMEDGATVLLRGTLTRIVTAVPNPEDADVRKVTFRLDYPLPSPSYSVEMTTERAIDD